MPAVRLRLEESPRYKDVAASTPFRLSTNAFWMHFTSLDLRSNPTHLSRDDEITGTPAPRTKVLSGFGPGGTGATRMYPNEMIPLLLMSGLQVAAGYPLNGDGTNEVQTITPGGTVTGGTYTLSFNSEVTQPIPASAPAALVQAFLERLPSVTPGDIVVSGGPVTAGALTLTFQGQYAARNVAQVASEDAALTGSTPTLTDATTTAGSTGSNLDPDGNGAVAGARLWQFVARDSAAGARARNEPVTAQLDAIYDGGPWLFGQGMAASSFAVSNDGGVSVDLLGLYADRYLADPALTPSYDAESVHPLLPKDLTVAWAAGAADISGMSWTLTNGLEVTPSMSRGTREHPGRIYLTTPSALRGSIDSSEFDPDDWDKLQTAETFAATQRYRSSSKIASTGCNYRMWVETPACQLVGGGPEALGERLRHGASYEWEANLSVSAGYAHRITLLTGVTAAETYS